MATVKEWIDYEEGLKYNQALMGDDSSYYEIIDANIEFSHGNQWRNVEDDDMSKPVLNLIKRNKQFKVASLTASNVAITLVPQEYNADDPNNGNSPVDMANSEIRNILDKVKFEFRIREGLGDAFDTGDMCAHWYFDKDVTPYKGDYQNIKGTICVEMIDGQNVMFGNPNNNIVEKQPYIIIIGRDLVKNLKEEAKKYKENAKGNGIEKDYETNYQASDNGKLELEGEKNGKALYIIYYYKKDGQVYATKCVKNAYLYKDVPMGLTYYPIAWMNWERQKNQYHGRAETTGLIPNQIAINRLLAMVVYAMMENAFPHMVYDAQKMSAPTNEIGIAYPIDKMAPGDRLDDVAKYLQVGAVNEQVFKVIDMLVQYTKDMMGMSDAALGNVNPDNTSAIIAVQKATVVPLENVKSNLYEFTEDCGRIILDIIATNYGKRPVVMKQGDNRVIQEFDFSTLKNMWLDVNADVGATGYASELATMGTLDALLKGGWLQFIDYLERMPENVIPKNKELIETIKQRLGMLNAEDQKALDAKHEQMAQVFDMLPPEEQQRLKSLPDNQLEAEMEQIMAQMPQQNEMQQQSQINNMIRGD